MMLTMGRWHQSGAPGRDGHHQGPSRRAPASPTGRPREPLLEPSQAQKELPGGSGCTTGQKRDATSSAGARLP